VYTAPRGLVEGNNWGDTFWGVTPQAGGINMLGRCLVLVRSELIVMSAAGLSRADLA